jgi:hypothetical protein
MGVSISFDSAWKLSELERHMFEWSRPRSIHPPASIEVICESCFSWCDSLESISLASNSKLARIEGKAFYESGLKSIDLPASVEMICEGYFGSCKMFHSILFE